MFSFQVVLNFESLNLRWCYWKVYFLQQTKNCTISFVAHQPTPGDTKEYGTSGPLLYVATESIMGFRQEPLDGLLHVTTEPSS